MLHFTTLPSAPAALAEAQVPGQDSIRSVIKETPVLPFLDLEVLPSSRRNTSAVSPFPNTARWEPRKTTDIPVTPELPQTLCNSIH